MGRTDSTPVRTYRGEAAHERRSRRRSRLLEAGLQLLGTEGWRATTVTAVCDRARLTPRYFYESFADRDALLVAIFDGVIDEITREVLAAAPSDALETLRATVTAFVKVVTDDPRKGRAAFVEAFGSEALMRRRFERMRWFADQLADQTRAGRRVGRAEARRLHTASLIAAGGLIETMIVWLDGGLHSTADQVIDDYTRLCTAALLSSAAG
jgi:AcrR family transcriptional regulator